MLDWRVSDDGACLVTSAVRGVPASALPAGAREAATARIAEVLHRLHGLDPAGCPFARPLAAVLAQAADVVGRGAVDPAFLDDASRREPPAALLARVEADAARMARRAEPVVCHGDPCLPNILIDPTTLVVTGLIDLGRLGVADRYADLALAASQLGDEWGVDARAFLAAYGVAEPDLERLAFYRLLDPLTWG